MRCYEILFGIRLGLKLLLQESRSAGSQLGSRPFLGWIGIGYEREEDIGVTEISVGTCGDLELEDSECCIGGCSTLSDVLRMEMLADGRVVEIVWSVVGFWEDGGDGSCNGAKEAGS